MKRNAIVLLICIVLLAGGFDVIVNKEGDAFVYTPFQAYFTGSFLITSSVMILFYFFKDKE